MSPDDSDNLTEVIARDGNKFVVLWSPETAEHDPNYRELGTFPTRDKAEAFLKSGSSAPPSPRPKFPAP